MATEGAQYYRVAYNVAEMRRVQKQLFRGQFWEYVQWIAWWSLTGGAASLVAGMLLGDSVGPHLWAYFFVGYPATAVFSCIMLLAQADREATRSFCEAFDCEVSDDGWSYGYGSGGKVLVPWSAMKLRFESQDALFIEFGQTVCPVLLRPLREAGLEEEFRARLAVQDLKA
jgi:hypothetical protein